MPSAGGLQAAVKGSVSWLWRSKLRSAIISGMSRSPRGSGSESSKLVVDDPHPGQAAPGVRRGLVEAVVVVPLERGPFRATVLDQVVDVGFARPRRQQQVVAGLARPRAPGGCGRSRRSGATSVSPPGWPSNWVRLWPPWRWTESSPALAGQLVAEGDLGPLAGGAADRRPGKGAAVGPEPGLAAGQDLRLGLADRDLDLGPGQLARDRQRRPERHRRGRARRSRSPNGSSSPRPPPLTGSR